MNHDYGIDFRTTDRNLLFCTNLSLVMKTILRICCLHVLLLCTCLGNASDVPKQFRTAYQLLNKADNTKLLAEAQIRLSDLYWARQADSCLYFAKLSLNSSIQARDNFLMIESYRCIGQAYRNRQEMDSSFKYLNKAFKLSRLFPNANQLAKITNNLGALYFSQRKYKIALDYFNQSATLAFNNSDTLIGALALTNKGNVLQQLGQFDAAFSLHHQAIEYFLALGDSVWLSNTINNLGAFYDNKGIYNKAIEAYYEALEIKDLIKDTRGLPLLILNIGSIHFSQGNYEKALYFFQRSLALNLSGINYNATASDMHNIANCYMRLSKFDSGYYFINKAIELRKRTNNQFGLASSFNTLGRLYLAELKYSEAEKLFNSVYTMRVGLGDDIGLIATGLDLAEVYTTKGDLKKANQYASQAYALANEYHLMEDLTVAAQQLYMIAKKEGNMLKALKYLETFHLYEDSLRKMEIYSGINRYEANYEFTKKEREQTFLLQQERLLKEQEILFQQQLTHLYAGILLVVLILLIVLYSAYKQRKQANEILEVQNKKIEEQKSVLQQHSDSLAELNLSKDKLFSVIAHDLKSPLSMINSMLNLLGNDLITEQEFKERIHLLSEKSGQASVMLDNLLAWAAIQFKGEAVTVESISINETVEQVVGFFQKQLQQKQITVNCFISADTFVHANKEMLMIVLRNLLANAIKYSHPESEIVISSDTKDGLALISVKDNGVGMADRVLKQLFTAGLVSSPGTNKEKGTGLGLMLSKDYITKLGGNLWATSEQNKGSVFYASLPLAK